MSCIDIRLIGITDLDADCIVNAANSGLAMGSGVCGAIFRAAGAKELQAACDKIGGCPTGEAVITPGFGLKAKYIVHAVGPIWHGGNHHEPQDLYSCYRESLDRAKENDCHSIGFPLISAGIFGYPKDKAWRKALQSCSDWIKKNPDYDINIVFAVLDDRILELGQKTMEDLGIKTEKEGDGKFVFFWKLHHKNEEFSNWYPREFVIEGIRYNCVEQYMMAKKAILFGDVTIYQQIMQTEDPGKCKDLGKLVRNFDPATWDSCKYEIVYNGNHAKFTQNPDLMAKLKATGDAVMAEASPSDINWGIGMSADDPKAKQPDQWQGENLLGKILMEIRGKSAGIIPTKTEDKKKRDRSRELNMIQETMQILEQGYYVKDGRTIQLKLSRKEMEEIHVYLPDDVKKNGSRKDFNPPYVFGRCGYGCENTDSFSLARERVTHTYLYDKDIPKILVLNLANAVNPGGGVRRGAKAQEEDLCRCSSLLLSLESRKARKYYDYNKSLHTKMGSDALMITPQVEIFRDENGELLDEPVVVSVVTCAAPMVSYGKEGMSDAEYEQMMYDRITGLLKCVAYLGYKNLVLGAWGCGAFGNDAAVISDLFYKALKELDYNGRGQKDLFNRIDFAVLDRTKEQYNFREFCRNFTHDNFYRDEKQQAIDEAMERIKETEVNLDRIRGCFVGGAAGDALGYTVEFSGEDEIFSRFGKEGITEYEPDGLTGKAIISDDTQMTLFTANGLLVGDTRGCMRGIQGWPRGYVAMAYQDWLKTQEISFEQSRTEPRRPMHSTVSWLMDVPELYRRRAPGSTCLSALKYGKPHGDDFIEEHLNDSKGCGGVMRVAPLALDYENVDIEKLDLEGAQIAAITHGHSLGYMPAAVLTHILHHIVFPEKEMSLKEIVIEAKQTTEKLFEGDKHLDELTAIIDQAIRLSENKYSDLNNIHRLGEGWVAEETLAIAIYCALRHQDDFSAGIIAAVNHKGDSDSTGAVTGNILGALLGYDAIDDKWKKDLELHDVIIEMADDICHGCQMSEYSDYEDPDWFRKYIGMQWKDEPVASVASTELIAVNARECQIIDERLGVQAVVYAADEKLEYGEFPAGQIIQAGGPELLAAKNALKGCKVGEAKITKGYGYFDSRYVIYTVDPRWLEDSENELEMLSDCYRACLQAAADNGIRSIAFPSIATLYKDNPESLPIPLDDAVKTAVKAVKEYTLQHPGMIDTVKWVLYDEETLKAYSDEIERWAVSEIVQSPVFYDINKALRNGGLL